jgi:hypothetical protein
LNGKGAFLFAVLSDIRIWGNLDITDAHLTHLRVRAGANSAEIPSTWDGGLLQAPPVRE